MFFGTRLNPRAALYPIKGIRIQVSKTEREMGRDLVSASSDTLGFQYNWRQEFLTSKRTALYPGTEFFSVAQISKQKFGFPIIALAPHSISQRSDPWRCSSSQPAT